MSKINIYLGENLKNEARDAGVKIMAQTEQSARYAISALKTPIAVFDHYTEKLRAEGSTIENSVILSTDKGILIEFIDALVNVTKQNSIKQTDLVNRAGTVKEYIQAKDYTVTISGNVHSTRQNSFPYAELVLLNYILSESKSLIVASPYLLLFDIKQLVLKTATFNQNPVKYFNALPFALTFDSDKNYDFMITE